jgi:hypothetical protein
LGISDFTLLGEEGKFTWANWNTYFNPLLALPIEFVSRTW